MWAALLMSIVSAMIAVIPNFFNEAEERHIQQVKTTTRATSADVMKILDKIKTRAQSLSYKQREKVANALGRVNFNAYISSGLSESLVNAVHHKLSEVQDQIAQLKTMGDVESEVSEGYKNQYLGMTDEQKSKAKIRNDVKITKENHPVNVYGNTFDKAIAEGKSKTEAKELATKAYYDANDALYKWNPSSEAGSVQIKAEEHANKAKEYYEKANALGEQYV